MAKHNPKSQKEDTTHGHVLLLYSVLIKKIRPWRGTKPPRSGDTKLRAHRSGSQLEARNSFNERAMSFAMK